jgi:3-phenylpropionate/trans-cinnamate dioxygenase ferredoxin reductase subunit
MTSAGIVIVGAGQSAAVAAHALREHGYRGRITMVGRERHLPYERPLLSKAVLVETSEPSLQVLADDTWMQCDIDLLRGIDAVTLDVAQQQVRLVDGQVLEYEKCLLATGGEARVHPNLPRSNPHVHYLRTIDDARRLRAALRHKPRVGILGGGFLGLEVAHSSIAAGASVSLIEYASCLLDRFLPAEASAYVHSALTDAGAQILLGTSISSVHTLDNGDIQFITNAGLELDVDEVIVAIGLAPNDALARDAGLEIAPGGGIRVDASCRTSNEHVFACGDCTSQRRRGQTAPTRLESWQNANEQARIAAAAMLYAAPPVPAVPWFWTDQGNLNIQILGFPAADLDYVRRGDPATGKALWLGHRNAVPVHGVAINAGAELRAIRPLFESGLPVPIQDFQLNSINLRAWAKQVQAHAVATV